MKKGQIVLIALLIFLASALRFTKLNQYPPALFSDEVDLGYQAYSFLKTGADYFGNKFPISFRSFADFRAPVYLYSAVGTIYAFGLTEWGVRLPAAIFGVLGILAFFLLILQVSKNFTFSLLSALVLTVLPWHIHYSRAGFEVTALFFFLCLGLCLFFRFLENRKLVLAIFSLIALSLCFYTYATSRLFLPFIGLFALLLYRKEIFSLNLKKLSLTFIVCFLFLAPFAKDAFLGEGLHRFSYLNIFSDSNLKFEIDRQRLVDAVHGKDQVVGMATPKFAYLFHNKPLSWAITIAESYISSFSFNFLVLEGDPNLRHGIGKMGGVLAAFLPFLVIGLFKICEIIKTRKNFLIDFRQAVFFLVFLLIAPLPSSITYDGGTHATRLFVMVLPLTLFISLGLWEFVSWFKKTKVKYLAIGLVFVFSCVNFGYYLHLYYYHYPLDSERLWHAGLKEGMLRIVKEQDKYDKIVISSTYEPAMIFFLFWSKYDPSVFNAGNYQHFSTDWFEGKQIGKYYFGRITSGFLDRASQSSQNNTSNQSVLVLAGRNDLGGDLNSQVPSPLQLIDKIYLPSKEPVLFLLEKKPLNN